LPTPVITINPRNQIWDANHSAIDLFKIKNDEIGQTIEEDPRFEFITQNRNAVTIAERVYQVKNESLEVSSLDRAGRIISLHDITEIQSLNEELKESNEILRTMNSEILKVTSFNRKIQTVLSHDLSALLRTGSNLFRGMAPSIPKEDSRIATSLENTLQSSLGLLNNILRWSHDEQISQFNLAALIASVRANVQPMAQENNVSIDVDLDRTEYSLELSQGVLDAILRNLISNAIKASPRGGLVKIKVHSEDKSLFIAVIDEGSGIDPQIIEGIYQTKPYSANGPSGFGVGLQFTYNFIRQLGGELRFKPNSPQGTIVEVTIPSRNLPVLK
ncbi:MAG TPA: HAMP domain-containing sensor histidine kinase, partial [Bdellovibrio sp.]|nr:HAMP domain-containing sensor histidine kinase [Bdellovibrio sp.]